MLDTGETMMTHDSAQQQKKRFAELARRAQDHYIWTRTDFLTMAEQDVLLSMGVGAPFTLYGGHERAERQIAFFGDGELTGLPLPAWEVVCLKIRPAAPRFAGELSHRQILGAVMGLGIDRKTTGDILVIDGAGYLFCLETISAYIAQNLTSAGRAPLRCEVCDPPERLSLPPEPTAINVASERLDGVIAAVYRLGRAAAKELVASERVFVNGRLISNPGMSVADGSIVSVRGHGRFMYEGRARSTKKGRLFVNVRIY